MIKLKLVEPFDSVGPPVYLRSYDKLEEDGELSFYFGHVIVQRQIFGDELEKSIERSKTLPQASQLTQSNTDASNRSQRQTQFCRSNPSRYHPFVRPTAKTISPSPAPSSQSFSIQTNRATVEEIDEDDEDILSVIKRESQAESSCNTTMNSQYTQESCESTQEESLLHLIKRETQDQCLTQFVQQASQEIGESEVAEQQSQTKSTDSFKTPCNEESDESLLATIKRETQNSAAESQLVKCEVSDGSVIDKIIQDYTQDQSTQHSMCLFSQY